MLSRKSSGCVGADIAWTAGITRKLIGATFEGKTVELDGAVWAECEFEHGPSQDVSEPLVLLQIPKHIVNLSSLVLARLGAAW